MHCQRGSERERNWERTLNAKIMNLNVRRDKSLRKRVKGRAHLLAKCYFHNLQDNLLYSIVYTLYINIYIHIYKSWLFLVLVQVTFGASWQKVATALVSSPFSRCCQSDKVHFVLLMQTTMDQRGTEKERVRQEEEVGGRVSEVDNALARLEFDVG